MYRKYISVLVLISFLSSSLVMADPQFSLQNKSNGQIAVHFWINEKNLTRIPQNIIKSSIFGKTVGKFHNLEKLDTAKSVKVEILYDDQRHFACIKAAGKTIYINWDPNKTEKIYPQRGPLEGLTGKTDLGYSTKNNVKSLQIINSSNSNLPCKDK